MKTKKTKSVRHRQLNLFKKDLRFFGGQLLYGKRKGKRPLSTKDPMHLVLRSSWAMGPTSFLRPQNKKPIESLITSLALKYGIRVYRKAIASNHLHLVVRIDCRRIYRAFIRVLSSKVALQVMKGKSFHHFQASLASLEKQSSLQRPSLAPARGDGASEVQGKGQQFWQFRPFNRVLFRGRDFRTCCDYVVQNALEAIGFLSYEPRKNCYTKWINESLDTQSG